MFGISLPNLGNIYNSAAKTVGGVTSTAVSDLHAVYNQAAAVSSTAQRDVAGVGKAAAGAANSITSIPSKIGNYFGGLGGGILNTILGPFKKYLVYAVIGVVAILGLFVIVKMLGAKKLKSMVAR